MIILHKMNGDPFALNVNHIETIEERPDTVITLVNDRKYLVKESMEELIDRTIEYQQKIHIKLKKIEIQEEDLL